MISVIVASYNARRTIAKCLLSVTRQENAPPFEVIVVDSSTDGTAELIAEQFPDVSLYRFEQRKFPGDARNLGVDRAHGELLAFLDADCFVAPDWVAEIARARQLGCAAVGGALENGNPESAVGWAHYFFEFSAWMPCGRAREQSEIPAGCLSVRRDVVDRYGPFPEGVYSSDSVFSWRLRAHREKLLFQPSIRIRHVNTTRMGRLVAAKFRHGRWFGELRAKEFRFTRWRRLAYILATPLLPWLWTGRVAWRVFRSRGYRARFLAASPLVFLVAMAWSCGECAGYARSGREPLPQKAESGGEL